MSDKHAPCLALVEDHADLREQVLECLAERGYAPWGVESAEAFYKSMLARRVDIALVDLGLPGEDGLSLIAHLRRHSDCGIIAMTARGSLDDRLVGLESGADHYLVKPVDLTELCLTIDNLWRRMQAAGVARERPGGSWRLEPVSGQLLGPRGERLQFSPQEARVLELLCAHPNRLLSKDDLHRQLFPEAVESDTHRVDVVISRIRRRAQEAGVHLPLRVVFGRGLVFVQEEGGG